LFSAEALLVERLLCLQKSIIQVVDAMADESPEKIIGHRGRIGLIDELNELFHVVFREHYDFLIGADDTVLCNRYVSDPINA
jgi:hypothetical protein